MSVRVCTNEFLYKIRNVAVSLLLIVTVNVFTKF